MSNEYGTFTNFPRTAWQCYHDTKAIKPSSFVIWTDGGYREDLPGDFVNDEATVDEKCAQPLIQHEFRWWSSFPDVRLMGKYRGAVRPYTTELAQKVALERGTAHLLVQAAENSQRLQLLEAKYNMELFRRVYPRLAGICHFNAMDTNPSPQGILDEFYEKKVASPAEWLQTNGDTVILSDLGCDNVVYSGGDRLASHLWVSDFSHPPLQSPTLSWKLVAGAAVLGEGQVEYIHAPYQTCPAGSIELLLPEVAKPVRVKLAVELSEGSRSFLNGWDLWLFPRQAESDLPIAIYNLPARSWLVDVASSGAEVFNAKIPQGTCLLLTERMDEDLADYIRQGGRALLAATEGLVRPTTPSWPPAWNKARYFFTPPANYPTYEDRVNGTILLDHPALGDLPHQGFADLLFFRMLGNSAPLDIGAFGLTQGKSILRCIHQYAVGRPLAYLVECALGRGGLILCSLDLNHAWPEARYLCTQLCRYALSDQFRPATQISEHTLGMLISAGNLL
jgi:hypothetical protein